MSQDIDLSARDAETVALFVEESLDGLQVIEGLLLEAEGGHPPAGMMGTLFRAVHTMKGTAGFLAYDKTQALAHAAEDLLSRLRDNKLDARPEHFSCLVSVADRLRALVTHIKGTSEEGDTDIAPLVAALHNFLKTEPASVAGQSSQSVRDDKPQLVSSPPAVSVVEAPVESVPTAAPAPASTTNAMSPTPDLAANTPKPVSETNESTVRVNVAVLDSLMNLIGELVLARNQIMQVSKQSPELSQGSQAAYQRLNLVTSELQEQVMKTRMQPVARVFEKIPRMVRDVARQTQKQVETQIEGNNTEIDKALVEAIRDPVMHIVRNAIDHGIEGPDERVRKGKRATGTVFVRAAHKGGAVTIEVEDDGKGMDPSFIRNHAVKKGVLSAAEAQALSDRQALELVFRPGFSTAAQVTDISGRGVGMDVVRTHVEKAGGQAEIDSTVGKGSTIRLKMPLTMAIIPALLVWVKGQRFAIPQVNLLELVYLTEDQAKENLEHVRGAPIHRLRGETLPVVDLCSALGLSVPHPRSPEKTGVSIVVVSVGPRRYSLVVEAIDNTEEIVIKPLRGQLKRISSYAGATVLGDGGVALILDIAGIATRAGLDLSYDRSLAVADDAQKAAMTETMVVFTVGAGVQCAVPLAVVARLESLSRSHFEQVRGRYVVQYRGALMPILDASSIDPSAKSLSSEEQQLIVFDFGQAVALPVSSIVDIAEVASDKLNQLQSGNGQLEQRIILGKTTMVVDPYVLVSNQLGGIIGQRSPSKDGPPGKILVFERSQSLRSTFTRALSEVGVVSTGVGRLEDVLAELKRTSEHPFDAVVLDASALHTPQEQGIAAALKNQFPKVGVVISTTAEHIRSKDASEFAGADAWVDKLNRESLVNCLRHISRQAVGRTIS